MDTIMVNHGPLCALLCASLLPRYLIKFRCFYFRMLLIVLRHSNPVKYDAIAVHVLLTNFHLFPFTGARAATNLSPLPPVRTADLPRVRFRSRALYRIPAR